MIRALIFFFAVTVSCYSFKGISIDPEVRTFTVSNVEDITSASPANYALDFGYALSNKIRRETRLNLDNNQADVRFDCKVTSFAVAAVAPVAGQPSAINRLTINMDVQFTDRKNEKNNWQKNFSRFEDFDASQSLNSVQDKLISNINKLLLEDIFNAAFSNW
ncbi:MAG: hypothetical protein K1X68_01665 [Saprospiraceae bacterium]|nr:hypothetical protein [Saprospiraceae bacterium]HMW39264.1 LPS assembly lipoprotein LptE [Saprospiraceae bacterium]HMX87968.1 LPS assembly lipoprotein LptE [Saprospiraceae bacterium]HMZ39982.1 LPS assembly lipoprotein LptE [Saprospiraceae bacterium]HNA63757.1 LPS assembly lipoprotein LptE [Saprospiraceae bacterium]